MFLCLNHHDQYDSRTRQSKNFTEAEVRHFSTELIRDIQNAFHQPIFFGSAKTNILNGIEGPYTRVEGSSAEICLTALPASPNRFHVSGFAISGKNEEFGQNTGELDFSANLIEGKLEFVRTSHNPEYKVVIDVSENMLTVEERNAKHVHGLGVDFEGTYTRCLIC